MKPNTQFRTDEFNAIQCKWEFVCQRMFHSFNAHAQNLLAHSDDFTSLKDFLGCPSRSLIGCIPAIAEL